MTLVQNLFQAELHHVIFYSPKHVPTLPNNNTISAIRFFIVNSDLLVVVPMIYAVLCLPCVVMSNWYWSIQNNPQESDFFNTNRPEMMYCINDSPQLIRRKADLRSLWVHVQDLPRKTLFCGEIITSLSQEKTATNALLIAGMIASNSPLKLFT